MAKAASLANLKEYHTAPYPGKSDWMEQLLNKAAVMASDAFFPFPDCVEIADKEGVKAVIQPGGSVKDELTFQYCNEHGVAMVTTGIRHFKH